MKKQGILLVIILFLLVGCSKNMQNNHQPESISEWFIYEDMVVGLTNLDEMKKICGEPLGENIIDEKKGFSIYDYKGFHLILMDDIVKTIIIEDETAPPFLGGIRIGDNLQEMIDCLPQQPIVIEEKMGESVVYPPVKGFQPFLFLTYDALEELSIKQLVIFDHDYSIQVDINIETDTIEQISILG